MDDIQHFEALPDTATDSVLIPIAGNVPAGPDLSEADDPLFDEIREARRADDTLPQGIWKRKRKKADWDEVVMLCRNALSNRSKDLRLAVWMLDAMVHREGFAALAPGFHLLTQFCQSFWKDLHPGIDEAGDLSARSNALELLNTYLPQILAMWPLTDSGISTPVHYSWNDYQTTQLYLSRGQQSPDTVTLEAINASAAATPENILRAVNQHIFQGLQELAKLEDFLDQECGRQGPSFEALKLQLREISGWLTTHLPEDVQAQANTAAADDSSRGMALHTTDSEMTDEVYANESRTVKSRDEAYRRLSEIAKYLQTVEPHSPVPYILERMLSWKDMSLSSILMEMSNGRNDLSAILELMHTETPSSPEQKF